jgi:BR serine/threonine kinase
MRDLLSDIEREIEIHSSLLNPHIASFADLVCERDLIFIVMEYCSGGDLLSWIVEGRLAPGRIRGLFRQILEGIRYLHSLNISHGDVKPENVLIDSMGNAKWCDFGMTRLLDPGAGDDDDSRSRTLMYSAPEVATADVFDRKKADIYSLGILLFCLVTKRFPWPTDDGDPYEIERMKYAPIWFPPEMDPDLRILCAKMTAIDPESRPTIEELIADPALYETSWVHLRHGYMAKSGSLGSKLPSRASGCAAISRSAPSVHWRQI